MSDDLLKSHTLLHSGNIVTLPNGAWLVAETRQQDDPGHTHFVIRTNTWGMIR